MPRVSIRHRTVYRYRNPVAFGEHRMMMRPQESFDQRIVSEDLAIGPEPSELRRMHDVFGNCVGIARFTGQFRRLSFDSRVVVDHQPSRPADIAGEIGGCGAGHNDLPYPYDAEETPDLLRSIERAHPDPEGTVDAWAHRFLRRAGPTSLQALLLDMTCAIHQDFTYGTRLSGPPQGPAETLARGGGSCRDFAVLMMEAARSLGLAARFVSGYVYNSSHAAGGRRGGGHTHAWTRIYLPGAGWTDFDPTNGIVGSSDLIRVAVCRDPRQAVPLHGTWAGQASDCLGMDVDVEVIAESEELLQPKASLRLASTG